MSRKLLSFLGSNTYKKCTYKYVQSERGKNKSYNTYFIQEALTEIMCKDWVEDDEVVIFLTSKSKKENYYPSDNKKVFIGDGKFKYEHRDGLKCDLERHNYKFNIKPVHIEDGNNMEEIWKNFDIIINDIDEGDEIIFDITHAFRYIPILALVVLNYAKSLKNIKIKGIYYGNYEYNNADKNPYYSKGEKPIMNLIELDEILEWSQAVDSFIKYGNSDYIKQFAEEVLKEDRNKDYYKNDRELIKKLVKSLNDFTNTVSTCRGRSVDSSTQKNSISVAYKKLKDNLDEYMSGDKNTMMKPLEYIIGNIQDVLKDFEPVECREEVINTGLAIVKWSINNNLIQQAYTALLETMVSYMCLLEGYNYNAREDRANVKKKYDKIYKDNKNKCLYGDLKYDLAELEYKLGNMRNDINHFGYSVYENKSEVASTDYTQLKQYIENTYEAFKKWVIKEENQHKVYV